MQEPVLRPQQLGESLGLRQLGEALGPRQLRQELVLPRQVLGQAPEQGQRALLLGK